MSLDGNPARAAIVTEVDSGAVGTDKNAAARQHMNAANIFGCGAKVVVG